MIYGIEYCKDVNGFQINTLDYIVKDNLRSAIKQSGRGWSLIGVAETHEKAAKFVEDLIKEHPHLDDGIMI